MSEWKIVPNDAPRTVQTCAALLDKVLQDRPWPSPGLAFFKACSSALDHLVRRGEALKQSAKVMAFLVQRLEAEEHGPHGEGHTLRQGSWYMHLRRSDPNTARVEELREKRDYARRFGPLLVAEDAAKEMEDWAQRWRAFERLAKEKQV